MARFQAAWQSVCRWLFSVADATAGLRIVRVAHYGLPLVSFSLLGPFFEVWADRPWLWILWGALLAGWGLCAMVLHGERLELGEVTLERTKERSRCCGPSSAKWGGVG